MGGRHRSLKKYRSIAIKAQEGLCFYCGCKMIISGVDGGHGLLASGEHLVRRCDGGRETRENIVAAHAVCNNLRGARTVEKHIERMRRKPRNFVYPAGAVFWCEEEGNG